MLLCCLTTTRWNCARGSVERRCVSTLNEFDSVMVNYCDAVVPTRLLRFAERVDLATAVTKTRNGCSIRRKTLTLTEWGLKPLLLQCLSLLHHRTSIVKISVMFLAVKLNSYSNQVNFASCPKCLYWWRMKTMLAAKWSNSMSMRLLTFYMIIDL